MNQEEANEELRKQLGQRPRKSVGYGPPDTSGLGDQPRMTKAEMREWIDQADRVETEDAKKAAKAGLVAGFIGGLVVGVVATATFSGVAHLAEAKPPRVVTRTVRVEVPREAPVGEPLYEERVPVCAEDERAVGVGDYRGSGHGGWEMWRCVHIDQLQTALGL